MAAHLSSVAYVGQSNCQLVPVVQIWDDAVEDSGEHYVPLPVRKRLVGDLLGKFVDAFEDLGAHFDALCGLFFLRLE